MQAMCRGVVTCVISSLIVASAAGQTPTASTWLSDFELAERQAVSTGATLVVHFHANWCGPCKVMERNVLSTLDVTRAIGNGIVAVKVNSDFRKDLVQRFGIKTLPTDVFVSVDGKVLARQSGYVGKTSYLASLSRYRSQTARNPSGNESQPGANMTDTLVSGTGSVAQSQQQLTKTIQESSADVPIVREVNVEPKKLTKILRAESEKRIGLSGYCPVSLAVGSTWESGAKAFRHEFQGVCYLLRSAEELNQFRANPERFVPVLHGLDPVALKNKQQLETGAIELGARYRNRVFFFSTQKNRDVFLQNPRQYLQMSDASHLKKASEAVASL